MSELSNSSAILNILEESISDSSDKENVGDGDIRTDIENVATDYSVLIFRLEMKILILYVSASSENDSDYQVRINYMPIVLKML